MSQPWGLSGPQFLVIYGVGTAVAVVVPFLLRLLIRVGSSAGADRQPDPYEAGCLAGGPARAAQVVIADFVATGAVRVDSSGRASVADRRAFDRQCALLDEGVTDPSLPSLNLWLPGGVSVHLLQSKIAQLPAIAAIKARLQAEGLLVSSARAAMARIVSVTLWATLFVTGGLRLAEGALNHRPVGDLEGLIVLSAFACLFSLGSNWSRLANLTTFRGARRLRRLRSAGRRREKEAARQSRSGAVVLSPGLAGNGFGLGAGIESAALFGVALAGFAAVTDASTRSALLASLPRYSGGSSCGGGGGGGGCGGGGGGCGG